MFRKMTTFLFLFVMLSCRTPKAEKQHSTLLTLGDKLKIRKKVSIVQNDGKLLKLDISGLAKGKQYYYSAILDEHLFVNPVQVDQLHYQNIFPVENNFIAISVDHYSSGTYSIRIYEENNSVAKPIWIQDVYSTSYKYWPKKFADKDFQDSLAAEYAPIVMFHEKEDYFPVSIPYLLNKKDKDPILDKEIYVVSGDSPFLDGIFNPHLPNFFAPFGHIIESLPYIGDRRAEIKVYHDPDKDGPTRIKLRTGSPEEMTIYYSFLDLYSRDQQGKYINKDEFVLYYHFFYSYDSKGGSADSKVSALGSHILDRESMGIVFKNVKGELKPQGVVYGGHLDNQKLALRKNPDDAGTGFIVSEKEMKESFFEVWQGDRIKIPWDHPYILKKGNNPVVAIAQGTHAVYPFPGTYSIITKIPGLDLNIKDEEAGIFGDKMKKSMYFPSGSYNPYKIVPLNLGFHTSDDPEFGVFTFSGGFVSVLLNGAVRFPPFTNRERYPRHWSVGSDLKDWEDAPHLNPLTDKQREMILNQP